MATHAAAGSILSKEMQVSWEPVRMVSPPGIKHGFHMSTLELSNLDLFYDNYASVLLFYDVNLHDAAVHDCLDPQQGLAVPAPPPLSCEPVKRLHLALEQLLVHYPSAAGMLVHNEAQGRVEGAAHMLAMVTRCRILPHMVCNSMLPTPMSTLSDLGDVSYRQPAFDVLIPSFPTQEYGSDGYPLARFVMALQVTTFKCGGFSLAHICSHAYADGHSGAMFLQNLCSIARGAGLAIPPDFSLSRRLVFPARDPPTPTMLHTFIGARKHSFGPHHRAPEELSKHLHYGTATRFMFSMEALEDLRAKVSKAGGQFKSCSRTQALMALLWTAYARVRRTMHRLPGSEEMTLRFPMNLRTRGIPKLTTGYVGNALYQCTVGATVEELCERPLADVVEMIKGTVGSLDVGEVVQSLIDDVEVKVRDGLVPFIAGSGGGLGVPTQVGLPFFDTDCGWGPPIYVGCRSQQLSNRCTILEHPAAHAWNVLAVFASPEERVCFEEAIADYISPNQL